MLFPLTKVPKNTLFLSYIMKGIMIVFLRILRLRLHQNVLTCGCFPGFYLPKEADVSVPSGKIIFDRPQYVITCSR